MLAAVVECHSIGRAAKELQIAQPALSRQLRSLEDEVGVTLLDRGPYGVRLTAAGREVTARTHGLYEGLVTAMGRARLAASGRLGTVRVALGRVALDDPRVGAAITAVSKEESNISVEVREISTQLHTKALLSGDVQLAVGTEETPHHRGLDRRTLRVLAMRHAFISVDHPLAGRAEVTPADLESLPLLVPGRAVGYRFPRIVRTLRDLGVGEPQDCGTLETAYALAAAGRGWVPVTEVQQAHAPFGLTAVRVVGLDVDLPLLVRWRRGQLTAVDQRVVRLVLRAYRGQPLDHAASAPAARPHVESNLELRHLTALVAVANDGSLTDAAHSLERTKSALSRQLTALERIVGAPLLERRGHALTLTAAGRVMCDAATDALATVNASAASARLAHRGIAKRLALGVVPTPLSQARTRAFFERLPREFPTVAVELHEMGSPQLFAALRSHEIDAAIMLLMDRRVEDPALVARFLDDDPLDSVIVASDGPLAGRVAVSGADLSSRPFLFISSPEGSQFLTHLLLELQRAGIEPRPGPRFEGPRALWRFVAHSDGWTVGVHSMRADPPPGVVAIPAVGLSIPTALCVVSRRDEPDARVRALVAAL